MKFRYLWSRTRFSFVNFVRLYDNCDRYVNESKILADVNSIIPPSIILLLYPASLILPNFYSCFILHLPSIFHLIMILHCLSFLRLSSSSILHPSSIDHTLWWSFLHCSSFIFDPAPFILPHFPPTSCTILFKLFFLSLYTWNQFWHLFLILLHRSLHIWTWR